MLYYQLVCGIHQSKSSEIASLAIQNQGCPTGTQYLNELKNQNYGEELFVFVSNEDVDSFVYQAYHTFGLYFYVISLQKLSNDNQSIYFRNHNSIIWNMLYLSVYKVKLADLNKLIKNCKSARPRSSADSSNEQCEIVCIEFENLHELNHFLYNAMHSLGMYIRLQSVVGICD